MLPYLGTIVQKHPMTVILIVIMVTVAFSIFIPKIEFKTDFDDFTPDDEIVKANERIQEYFGEGQQLIFIYATKENSQHVLKSDAIREIYQLQKELENKPGVEGSFSIVTFLDMICFIEYGSTLMDCTDNQIETALQDLLLDNALEDLLLLQQNDPNEEIDYVRFPRIQKGKSIDSADIKNCIISKNEEEITFSIEVYDLEDISSTLNPVFPKVNVMEWYVSFQNQIMPIEELNITYKIAAHIEPQQSLWMLGNGVIDNFKTIIQQIKDKTLFNNYKKEVYLWVQPAGQSFSLPISLSTGNITFNNNDNLIEISVSLKELSNYGIAPQLGSFALPAKLSNFQAGTRYYQNSFLKHGGGRISANTDSFIEKLFQFQSKPIFGKITESLLQKFGGLSWEEFEEYYEMMESTSMIPDTLALKDIESKWIYADTAPDDARISDISFSIIPAFYKDIQLNIRSFLSTDFEENYQPSSTLIFIQLTPTKDYDEIIKMNKEIAKEIQKIDDKNSYIKTRVTGMGISSAEINELTTDANRFIAPSIFIIIVSVLLINFRRFSYVVLPMFALVVSMIWLFGAMSLLGISFNVIAIAIVPLILGLGVDYSVHILHNYRVELRNGKTPAKAIKNSVSEIGTAMFLAMITTVIAFLSFLTASVPPIRDFGILLALGVTFTFITSITLLPALRYILDKRATVTIKRKV
ncbi:hypothetical protein B6U98_01465 [Thermoplasmatales archaeon ex4572_165]|nr:MAG: hypothetical protein B6U98_01465 [Thermoplasmatales archaeon ex4572_165]